MGARLKSGATLVGPAAMPGRLFDLGAYPGALYEPEAGSLVVGEVWRMRQPRLLLRQLDIYEDCAPGQPGPHAFRREVVDLALMGNRSLPAWVYLWTGDPAGRRAVIGGDWLLHSSGKARRPLGAGS